MFLTTIFQAVDQKKEDFRRYLERNGIIDSLTKGIVNYLHFSLVVIY